MIKDFVSILKSVLISIVFTLLGVVVFAVILKFVDMPQTVVSYINDIIKGISIFFMVILIKKHAQNKLLLKVVIGSLIYAVLTFIIFSVISGKFNFNLSILYDILFAVIVGVILTIISNILSRKRA